MSNNITKECIKLPTIILKEQDPIHMYHYQLETNWTSHTHLSPVREDFRSKKLLHQRLECAPPDQLDSLFVESWNRPHIWLKVRWAVWLDIVDSAIISNRLEVIPKYARKNQSLSIWRPNNRMKMKVIRVNSKSSKISNYEQNINLDLRVNFNKTNLKSKVLRLVHQMSRRSTNHMPQINLSLTFLARKLRMSQSSSSISIKENMECQSLWEMRPTSKITSWSFLSTNQAQMNSLVKTFR